MGQTRRRRASSLRQKKKQNPAFCAIPIPANALHYSYDSGADFYNTVNKDWLTHTKIPSFETDFSAAEEVERCINAKSTELIRSSKNSTLTTLADSALHGKTQQNSVNYLKEILHSVNCSRDKQDIMSHFSAMARSRITSVMNFQYHILPNKKVSLKLGGNAPGLPIPFYTDPAKIERYKDFLDKLGSLFEIHDLSHIYEFEKTMVHQCEMLYNDEDRVIRGGKLLSKFPKIPWNSWFSGIDGWKSMNLYYNSPRWLRYLGKVLDDVPLSYWKYYIAKTYILYSLKYLPPPFDDLEFEFFGHFITGQKEKLPQMEVLVNSVYRFLPNLFSKIFWNETGNPKTVETMRDFSDSLVASAKKRLSESEWLEKSTIEKAIEKVSKMKVKTVRPDSWDTFTPPNLDSKNFLKNILDLGSWGMDCLLERLGKTYDFWEEGIFRVNAYYYSETNEIIIPYGTIQSPFYKESIDNNKYTAWNYGALGSIIGHEMCHGFDEDGKEFDAKGSNKKWWSPSDNRAYKRKTRALVQLFKKQKYFGKHVDGENTLNENIADLGGLAIALGALNDFMESSNTEFDRNEQYRMFFTGFATSWRTIYRPEKLKSMLNVDVHAPAQLRVNLIVSQFQEWYDAFDIQENAPMYIPADKRIRIF